MTTIKRRPTSCTDLDSSMHPVLQKIYAARGIRRSVELEKELSGLIPFDKLLGIHKACELLGDALMQQQRIMIIGDFDTDGATSTSVAITALRALGAQHLNYLVPNRFEYGYGLTPEIVEVAKAWQPDVIVTVDNGISSVTGVAAAKAIGAKVLITDHHLPGDELPAADAIVNPNQRGCEFPSKNLAGVGVIFYVMLALRCYLRQQGWFEQQQIPEPNMGQLLDLVALGTIADVVPLDANNRILAHQGLRRIRAGRARPGIMALLNVAKRTCANIAAQDLGFAVAPRLNAAGRLDDMSLGIACLLSEHLPEAMAMASQLDLLNQERKQIEAEMSQQAFESLNALRLSDELPAGLCLYDANWHQGVIGILASRLKERCHRPVVAFAKVDDTYIKGSARSIPGIHIRDCLDNIAAKHPDLVPKFGGHAMAAGLSLKETDFASFQQAFAAEIAHHFDEATAQGMLYTDGELQPDDFTLSLAELLRYAEPWGQGFPEPLFDGVFKLVEQRLVGAKHLKMTLCPPNGQQLIDAIAFNIDLEQWPNHRAQYIQAVYRLDVNEFRGRKSAQLMIEHLTESSLSNTEESLAADALVT